MSQIRYQWNGITKSGIYSVDFENTVQTMFIKSKNQDWKSVIDIASTDISLVNCVRPGSDSFYTILHSAARIGAPVEVIEKIIELGAFRTMKTKNGETASDLAHKYGHEELVSMLTPKSNYEVEQNNLKTIEKNLHMLIIKKTEDLVSKHLLRLPDICILLELQQDDMVYFPIPGMMGGIFFSLNAKDKNPILNVQIESRMWGGADYYEVSKDGIRVLRQES